MLCMGLAHPIIVCCSHTKVAPAISGSEGNCQAGRSKFSHESRYQQLS